MSEETSLKTLLAQNTMDSARELVFAEPDGAIRCVACGHRCKVHEGKTGVCRVRFNEGGRLRVPAGYVAGLQIDPIEKKPFYHVFPGHDALSFGMLGCDFHCSYCQNWVSSQTLRDNKAVALPRFCDAEQLVTAAEESGVPVIVSTYNEPLITADWAMMVFRSARERGIRCGFVSNGNATPEVLEYIRPCVDLYKVDLKSFNDHNYRRLGGVLDNVLATIRLLKRMDFWVEIVTLVVPGFNDSDDELKQIAGFVADVSPDIPWHVTAFHPDYKMTDNGRTPSATLARAYEVGESAGLRFVYAGNLPGGVGDREHTYCPACRAVLIRRRGFHVLENRMRGSSCPECNATVPGTWGATNSDSPGGARFPRAVDTR
jgi:pyruvate formate lyase activating enzyme